MLTHCMAHYGDSRLQQQRNVNVQCNTYIGPAYSLFCGVGYYRCYNTCYKTTALIQNVVLQNTLQQTGAK